MPGLDRLGCVVSVLNLEHLKPGMKLVGDVMESSGRVLLSAGTVINERHLKIFKTWGITEANVAGSQSDEARNEFDSDDPEDLSKAKAHASRLFRHTDQRNPVIRELIRLCILRSVEEKNRTGADAR